MTDTLDPRSWLYPTPRGLYCKPGDFYIDPAVAVPRAVVTHGHGDHARPGHRAALATPETLADHAHALRGHARHQQQPLKYGESVRIGDVDVELAPAGHILGSAQAVLAFKGQRIVVSGDFKRRPDPTCPPFEPIPCDVFITEATFALPVFHHLRHGRDRQASALGRDLPRTYALGGRLRSASASASSSFYAPRVGTSASGCTAA